jgi:hypothetical protein
VGVGLHIELLKLLHRLMFGGDLFGRDEAFDLREQLVGAQHLGVTRGVGRLRRLELEHGGVVLGGRRLHNEHLRPGALDRLQHRDAEVRHALDFADRRLERQLKGHSPHQGSSPGLSRCLVDPRGDAHGH